MNHKTKPESTEKRASLKRLRNAGIGSAVVASMGTSEWMRPVMKQVILPAHAQTTRTLCEPPSISAVKLACSAGQPIEITIAAKEGSSIYLLSVPAIVATPVTAPNPGNDWKTLTSADVAPAVITSTDPYDATTRGPVMDEDNCFPPANSVLATDVPNGANQQPLTSLYLTFEYVCSGDPSQTVVTETVNIMDLV